MMERRGNNKHKSNSLDTTYKMWMLS
nr:unnamed protein product [Callosobruchus analis]